MRQIALTAAVTVDKMDGTSTTYTKGRVASVHLAGGEDVLIQACGSAGSADTDVSSLVVDFSVLSAGDKTTLRDAWDILLGQAQAAGLIGAGSPENIPA